ncbi:MAG TPA: gliding motility-associated C-terminal domain-containing protein [Saprospiraceae bacterium]|nr:gliding motility-associated C-terminal domain-containing protein [Saprospiraceae bacterium]
MSIFLLCQRISAQTSLCTGSLGENIFSSGDFGSGIAIVFPSNPNLAPGFIYTTHVPPANGEYTLTNDMTKWPMSFPTWIRIGDNSPDPNGYMMVINATTTPGIFYEQSIDNVCENTLYEFSADIINLISIGTPGHILPDVSFLIDDVVLYNTGAITQDEKWHTHGFTFTSRPGQYSLKLTLRNNSPGSQGNDLAIDNISFRACGPVSSISVLAQGKICENSLLPVLTAMISADTGAIQWQSRIDTGMVWEDIVSATDTIYQINLASGGIYYYRYLYGSTISNLTNSKCRIVSDSIRVEYVPVEVLIEKTVCEGQTFDFGGIAYGQTGIYEQHLTASDGCDSIVTLDLLVVPDPPIIADFIVMPPSCEAADDGSISVLSVSGARPPFTFRINDSIIPAPSTSYILKAGSYTAWILDENGCYDKEEIIVPDGPPLNIQTIQDTTIVIGNSILLETKSNLPVWIATWNPPAGLDCPHCLSPLARLFDEQTYVITAETEGGCTDMDSVTIRVDRDLVLFIPNIFSPNNDQINDFFEISSNPFNITSIDLAIIFDRWGNIISEKTNLSNEGRLILWDGSTPVGPAHPGTYVYLIRFTMADGTKRVRKGDVTIIK